MKRLILIMPCLLAIMACGCKPIGRAYASLQYHNTELRLVKSVMTMTVGDGKVDARRLMERETYVGEVTVGRVTARYPEGLEAVARDLAVSFDQFYPVVSRKLGVDWSFDLVLNLVRVEPGASGFRYSVKLPKDRRITFPVPVSRTGPHGWWTPVIAHELTEASMLAPRKRAKLVLSDLYSGPLCIPAGTRWFRDGAADYAQYIFASCPPPEDVYEELNRVRAQILYWSNCKDEPNWYDAAAGLMVEMTNRYGEDSIARMMDELSHESVPDGGGLVRAFKRATGASLREFLESYETPWAGFVVRDTTRNPAQPCGVLPGNRVIVSTVYPATPASRRGIEVGDAIVSFAGEPVTSAAGLANSLARRRPWEIVQLEVERSGQLMPMKLKLIPRPVDIGVFLRLSGAGGK